MAGRLDPNRPKAERSQQIQPSEGPVVLSSTLDDFVAAYQEAGLIKSRRDLIENHPNLCTEIQFNWYMQGRVACLFAMKFACHALTADDLTHWTSVCLDVTPEHEACAEIVAATLEISHLQGFEAAQVLFPRIETAEGIADLITALCELDSFDAVRVGWSEKATAKEQLLLGLRWKLPGGDATSEILGTASMESMPATRHTPFVSIVARTQPQPRDPPGDFNKGRRQVHGCPVVHLADMNDLLGDQQQVRERWWEKTAERKRFILSPELSPAVKARVTFALPLAMQDRLSSIW